MKRLHSHVRTTEIDNVSDRLLVLYRKESGLKEEDFLKPLFADIETLSAQITEAIKRDVSFSRLEDADLRRDTLLRSLNTALLGYRTLPVPSLKENAEKLYGVFSKYGIKITRESYAVESSLIESLLQDFSTPDMQQAISELFGVEDIVSDLRTEQTAFTELRADYEKTLSKQKNATSASSLKKPLLEAINVKLIPYLIAMKIARPAQYKAFAEAVEQVIDTTNSDIKRRNKNKKDMPEEEE